MLWLKRLVDRLDDFGGVIDRLIELGAEEEENNTFAQIDFGDYLERLKTQSIGTTG